MDSDGRGRPRGRGRGDRGGSGPPQVPPGASQNGRGRLAQRVSDPTALEKCCFPQEIHRFSKTTESLSGALPVSFVRIFGSPRGGRGAPRGCASIFGGGPGGPLGARALIRGAQGGPRGGPFFPGGAVSSLWAHPKSLKKRCVL
jgi:hypothetical protein